MENRAHALAVGLFILVLGAAILFSLLWFRGSHAQRDMHIIVARTSVSGLSTQAVVKLRGVEVGSVESVAFDPADPRQILIRVAIDMRRFLLRGLRGVQAEWQWCWTAFNFKKLMNLIGALRAEQRETAKNEI